MFKRYKAAKRVLALLLCGCLVFGSVNQARFKSYAIVTEIIAGGAAIAGGLAIGYLLHMLGVTASSKEVYKSKETVIDWANEQVSRYKKWNAATKDAYHPEDLDKEFDAWTTNLRQGMLDKSSSVWSDFKSWVHKGVYSSSGSAAYMYNKRPITQIGGKYVYGTDVITAVGCRNYLVLAFKDSTAANPYKNHIGVVSDESGQVYVNGEMKEFREYEDTFGGKRIKYYYCDCFPPEHLADGVTNCVNYLGNFGMYYEKASFDAFRTVRDAGGFASKDTSYGYTGGISDVYNKSNVLDNVDIVGGVDAPTAVGAVSVPIAWPVNEDTLVDTLGGVQDGSIPWDKTLSNVGTAAVDVVGGKTYVIGNEGVTTKEYVYAKDKADAKDEEITVPDVVAPSANLGAYTIAGLEKMFPFCLPFDLIDFIKVLDAPAEAPRFTIPFKYPTRGGMATYDIVIDLSSFNSVAELLRDMECLAFIVGLIMITRSRMIRG